MDRKHWLAIRNSRSLGEFLRSREVMFHKSKTFFRNPLALVAAQEGKIYDGPQFLPYRGNTYAVGRNAAKRAARHG